MANNRNGEGSPAPQGNGEFKPLAGITAEQWGAACSAAGFTVDKDGNAVIGITGNKGSTVGYLAVIAPPTDIDMANLVRALLGHALRVGQQGIKKKGVTPSRDLATTAANSALKSGTNGGYNPARERKDNILQSEAEDLFAAHIRALVLAAKPNATDDDVAATLKQHAASDAGKAWIEAKKAEVLATGTFAIAKDGEASAGEVVVVNI